jgi:hypothetical protein
MCGIVFWPMTTTSSPLPQQVWVRYWPLDYPDIYEIRITRIEEESIWGTIINGAGRMFPTGKETYWSVSTFLACHKYVRDEATIHDRLLSDEPFRLKPVPAPPPKNMYQQATADIQAEEDRWWIGMCDDAIEKLTAESPPEPLDIWERLMGDDDGLG